MLADARFCFLFIDHRPSLKDSEEPTKKAQVEWALRAKGAQVAHPFNRARPRRSRRPGVRPRQDLSVAFLARPLVGKNPSGGQKPTPKGEAT